MPSESWIVFGALVLAMLGVDLFFHRGQRAISIKSAVRWSLFWIGLALSFNLYIYLVKGHQDALNFLTGYLIEKSLSIDNLFVFLLIFKHFKTPVNVLHKVLFLGVFGAILMRALFIWVGISLITKFHWMVYLFGLFLIYTGVKFWFEKERDLDVDKHPVLLLFRRFFPITDNYVGSKFFVKKGVWCATPLFVVLLLIETTDVIFAIDSIPAILAITYDPFIVYTSNIFAILGLRSLYFVLQGAMDLFEYLHYALASMLVFVGLKMLLSGFVAIPIVLTFAVIVAILGGSVALSLYKKRGPP